MNGSMGGVKWLSAGNVEPGRTLGEGAGLRLWGAKPIGSDVVTRREKSEWIEPPVSTWWCNVINVSRSRLSLIL